ncbi:hypothetical protein THASP1DRAFT_31858 [Thamnocephalis sphaerospora]|uniref:G-patch domain-containing protein n=1 Tax=Thamnocephalis sphaerospora TaxID=78915 RepID=A0A4P9XKI8_9FUNG|nr:hypothetical protein THASP1DRAFT_31858 [Thamnocephalis sphaerospora]|eukprot:RKP06324.1 hypothetical protein THASP1DRAFT_31858 [Thamnocephalis sphaerospora]
MLPGPEEVDRGQFVPEWKQEVRDEQGRRRFHGAFTGGFSAGYFNTVGSKEGWAPSTFVSSRKNRAQREEQRVEDFMDQEDRDELAEGQKQVAKSMFNERELAQQEQNARRAIQDVAGSGALSSVTARIMEDLVVPTKEAIGIRLLKRMGWKDGQGIGPRQTPTARATTVLDDDDDDDSFGGFSNSYGYGLGAKKKPSSASTASTTLRSTEITFAPKDVAIVEFKDKKDQQGLGYQTRIIAAEPAQKLERLTSLNHYQSLSSNGPSTRGGYSMMIHDDEDDDESIYSAPSRTHFNMTLIDDEEDNDITFTPNKAAVSQTLPVYRPQPRMPPTGGVSRRRICQDGRPPLPGFHLTEKTTVLDKWFEPPKVPEDFTPYHVFNESGPDGKPPTQAPPMNAERRSELLGEERLDGPQRSVFDYISPSDRQRLEQLSGRSTGANSAQDRAPPLDPALARAALQGFMPFADNPAKQARYRRFLEVKSGQAKEFLPTPSPPSGGDVQAAEEHEFHEFIQAARIFRPVSGQMAARFTSAQIAPSAEELKNPEPGLRTAPASTHSESKSLQQTGATATLPTPKVLRVRAWPS